MAAPPVRIRQALLIAMSAASFPGEKLAALDFLRRTLIAMGHDEHWLVARLQVDDSPYEIIVQRKFDASWAEGWPT